MFPRSNDIRHADGEVRSHSGSKSTSYDRTVLAGYHPATGDVSRLVSRQLDPIDADPGNPHVRAWAPLCGCFSCRYLNPTAV